jgi:malate dehydrogenase (oxaloacetate-decarboxylating)
MPYDKKSLQKHKALKGKLEILSKVKIESIEDLATYYTPGVAAVSREIAKNSCKVWDYTIRGNFVAVISDGSAVLGLGNIGPEAAHPVMAGKAILFKEFAGIDAFPICLATQDSDEIVAVCRALAPSFGGINLEDISAPRCFEIERRLQDLGIPVMHDDQHGTAVVVLAGLVNAMKVLGKKLDKCKIVVNGLGAAGTAVALMISEYTNHKAEMRLIDIDGLVCSRDGLDEHKTHVCAKVNSSKMRGTLEEAIKGADIFIGLSAPNILTAEMVKTMNKDAIVFAMANPVPEIDPAEARKGGAKIIATGRSDYPNQVNNVLAFPGIFRGALDARATKITEKMKFAAAEALASAVKKPTVNKILPTPLEKGIAQKIAEAIKKQAIKEGVIRPVCR